MELLLKIPKRIRTNTRRSEILQVIISDFLIGVKLWMCADTLLVMNKCSRLIVSLRGSTKNRCVSINRLQVSLGGAYEDAPTRSVCLNTKNFVLNHESLLC